MYTYALFSFLRIFRLPSRSGESPESGPEEDGDSAVDVEVQPPYPFNQSLLSSEESEGEEQEEARDLPATPWHPKPLGVSTETQI